MHPLKLTLAAAALLAQGLGAAQALPVAQPTRLIRDGLAATDTAVAASLPRYLQSRSARFVGWLSDGSLLIATRFGDTLQIHRVRTPLGMREQLTFAPGGVITAAARPFASDALVYVAPGAGGGTQLFLQRLGEPAPGGRSLRALTVGDSENSMPRWAPDGARVAYVSARRGAADADVYVLDARVPDAAPRLVAAGNGARWRIDGWSPDGRQLLLGRLPPLAVNDRGAPTQLYIAEVGSGTINAVAPPSGPEGSRGARRARRDRGPLASYESSAAAVAVTAARFASDGSGLLLLTHGLAGGSGAGTGAVAGAGAGAGHEYLQLIYLDPADGRSQRLSAPSAHDVQLFDESPDGRYIAYTFDEAGASQLMLFDQRLKLQLAVGSVPAGIISTLKFDATGTHLALTLQSSRSPPDVYVLQPVSGTLTRWTHSEVGLLDTQAFVQPQRLEFATWDRVDGQDRRLLALGYDPDPDTIGAGAPRPVVVWLCSGGGTLCRPRFAPFVQYLVRQLGFVVIAPEVRGSSGLGASLRNAGQGPLRDDAVRDVGALLAWIGLQPGLDRSRVALFGEGFGSYLALQALTEYGDRVRGAVAAFPPALSGLVNVAAIRRPVLLVQGLDTQAAPAYQVAQLREGLRAQGVAVEYLAAAGEDFTRRSTRDAYHLAAASFLARLLR